MTLDPGYLDYPNRRHGQDMNRHDWRLAKNRARVDLPEGKQLAVMAVVVCEYHPIDPAKTPFGHPHGMVTPFPDLRHYTTRDYGNRVGVFRILKAFREAGLTATFALSADLLERARPLVDAIINDGHEIAAAGLNGDAIHHSGLSEDEERALIARTRDAFNAAGLEPTAWQSPARQESFNTPDLLTEAGFTTVLDWETDQVPVFMRTKSGHLAAPPVFNELDDYKLLIERKQTEDLWARQILETVETLKAEHAQRGSQVLGFTLTPFVTGQPFRIKALEAVCQALTGDEAVWCAGASEVTKGFEALNTET
jgi:peptidoglycan/xylan/chitin deacetylase (PgdA/CDA1 family)